KELEARNRDLTESLEQQTATSEILRVISSSPTDVQPVFDAIVQSASSLCEAEFSAVVRFEDGLLHLAGTSNVSSAEIEAYHSLFLRPPGRDFIMGRAFLDWCPVHVEDVLLDPDYDPQRLGVLQRAATFRTYLGIPIVRNGIPIGAIGCGRYEVRPFIDAQIELVKTFANQAVIAIENVRLFNETKEALDQQTATGEILRVIASSPTDIQPVLDAVADSAARLTATLDVVVFLRDGDGLRLAAHHGPIPVRSTVPLILEEVTGLAVLDGQTVHVADLQSAKVEFPGGSENARRLGLRTVLSVPLVREGGIALGTINLRRAEVLLFTERQVSLLQTFADQAVIAIENVRLFTELEEKNRALTQAHAQVTESLEQQTATSEILRVISTSPTDLQPV